MTNFQLSEAKGTLMYLRDCPNDQGILSYDGEFKDGKWMKKKVFPLTETGWNISIVAGKHNAQLEK